MATAGRDGMNGASGRDGRDSRPVPDPTVLSTLAIKEAVGALREIVDARLDGQKAVFETRLAGMDEAIKLLQTILDRNGGEMDVKVGTLQALHDEKFRTVVEQFLGVQTQFSERDVRGRDAALANTTAVNAALQAQKEAAGEQAKSFTLSIDKSEKGTLEQITQQRVLLETMKQGMDGKVDDLKERMTRVESIAVGTVTARTEQATTHAAGNQNIGTIIGVIGVVAVLITLVERFVR